MEMVIQSFVMFRQDVVLSVNNLGPLFGKALQKRIVVIHDVWFLEKVYAGPNGSDGCFEPC